MHLSDSELFDAVKDLGSRTDAQLAELLKISPVVISLVRSGRRALPIYNRVVGYDLLGNEWARMVLKHVYGEDSTTGSG